MFYHNLFHKYNLWNSANHFTDVFVSVCVTGPVISVPCGTAGFHGGTASPVLVEDHFSVVGQIVRVGRQTAAIWNVPENEPIAGSILTGGFHRAC